MLQVAMSIPDAGGVRMSGGDASPVGAETCVVRGKAGGTLPNGVPAMRNAAVIEYPVILPDHCGAFGCAIGDREDAPLGEQDCLPIGAEGRPPTHVAVLR